jgi:CRP/FNR family cyclic AMP-dependent transcriptional regulator
VVAAGDFFGEACLAGQDRRMASATALTSSTMLVMQGGPLRAMVRAHVALAERLLVHTLTRNIRIEDDLVDQLFNSCEKRLARALLLLAHHGKKDEQLLLGHVSQRTLAQMVGSTRSRVNFFMNRFRELGFLEYNGTILVNRSLLTVLAHDSRKPPSSSVSH